jgi:hypothetical protein
MNSNYNIKKFILDKTIEYIQEMPQDVYALYYFINTNEGAADVPTLALMYNTLSELGEDEIEPTEMSWNIACWNTEEFPIIGNNEKETEEAKKSISLLSEWFIRNGYDSSKKIKDPLDDYFETTEGYRILSEIIEKIAPDVKKVSKNHFKRDVVLLLGEYSYMPTDVRTIESMNGIEANSFKEYYDKTLCCNEELNRTEEDSFKEDYDQTIYWDKELNRMLKDGFDQDSEYGRVFSEFLEKIREEFKK